MAMPLPKHEDRCLDFEGEGDRFERAGVGVAPQVVDQPSIAFGVLTGSPCRIVANAGSAHDADIGAHPVHQPHEAMVQAFDHDARFVFVAHGFALARRRFSLRLILRHLRSVRPGRIRGSSALNAWKAMATSSGSAVLSTATRASILAASISSSRRFIAIAPAPTRSPPRDPRRTPA